MKPVVERAGPADLVALCELEHAVFGAESYPGFFLRQAMALWPDWVLVARPAGGAEPVGYMLAAKSAREGEGWILSAATHPAWRGRGIGQALLQQLLATLDAAGLTEIRLTVHPANTVAVRLYERAGFVREARDGAYFGPDQPRLIMVRRKPV